MEATIEGLRMGQTLLWWEQSRVGCREGVPGKMGTRIRGRGHTMVACARNHTCYLTRALRSSVLVTPLDRVRQDMHPVANQTMVDTGRKMRRLGVKVGGHW
jgi:hypothetical protein